MLERPEGYIVNVDGSDKPGSHWVAMFFPTTPDGEGDGVAEFMDPLGEKPNHYSEHFKTFLENNSSTYIYNKYVLQSPWSNVCGQYCLFYALHRCRNIPMSTITNMFTNDKEWNDMLVRDFIYVNGFLCNKCIKRQTSYFSFINLFISYVIHYLDHLYDRL